MLNDVLNELRVAVGNSHEDLPDANPYAILAMASKVHGDLAAEVRRSGDPAANNASSPMLRVLALEQAALLISAVCAWDARKQRRDSAPAPLVPPAPVSRRYSGLAYPLPPDPGTPFPSVLTPSLPPVAKPRPVIKYAIIHEPSQSAVAGVTDDLRELLNTPRRNYVEHPGDGTMPHYVIVGDDPATPGECKIYYRGCPGSWRPV